MSSYRTLKQWQAEDFGRLKSHEAAYFRRELARVPLPPGSRVLELGFGNGSFLTWAQQKGCLVHGVEADEPCVQLAQRHGFQAFTLPQAADLQGYDLVVAFDVLEHLDAAQLHTLFHDLRHRLLKPGGHLVARFPNGQSPFGLVNQHGDITHQSAIGREKIVQLCNLHGLQIVAVRNPALWLHSNPLVATARLGQRAAAKLLEIAIGLAFHSRLEPMYLNLVAHLRRPVSDIPAPE